MKNRDYGVKTPVSWCPDLISFIAKALNTPNTHEAMYAVVQDAVVQEAVVEEPVLPFGINEPYVNYKFTFLEKTRCALHITKDTVSEILEKSNENQENLYSNIDDAVPQSPPPPPPPPPPPKGPGKVQGQGQGE